MSKGKPQEPGIHQKLRKIGVYAAGAHLLVRLRYLGQSCRGKKPDGRVIPALNSFENNVQLPEEVSTVPILSLGGGRLSSNFPSGLLLSWATFPENPRSKMACREEINF